MLSLTGRDISHHLSLILSNRLSVVQRGLDSDTSANH
jgi:hypothetical protein